MFPPLSGISGCIRESTALAPDGGVKCLMSLCGFLTQPARSPKVSLFLSFGIAMGEKKGSLFYVKVKHVHLFPRNKYSPLLPF